MYKSLTLLFSLFLCACANSIATAPSSPETESAKVTTLSQVIKQGMVVTANPHATKAGADVLRNGGSAVDAAIAIQSVLSLVEPQSSGMAGGGFMIHFENQDNTLSVYDGREKAPETISPTQFLDTDGEVMNYFDRKHSGLSTGVPGIVSMLQLAHADHGKLPWGSQFKRASELAEGGFEVSARLHYFTSRFARFLPKEINEGPPDAYEYFYDTDGKPYPVGYLLKNPAYAQTLKTIAEDPRSFYEGDLAKEIVAKVRMPPRSGALTLDDMVSFKASKKTALCSGYGSKKVCGPPPPSSWLAVGEIMGLIDSKKPFDNNGAASVSNWIEFAEAQRLAYADRDRFVGDAEFVKVPTEGMLSRRYWQKRMNDGGKAKASQALAAGDPWAFESQREPMYGSDNTVDMAGTTHFVVMDSDGDVVSMTSSVESIFGSARMSGGMFLNNQLTDFASKPTDPKGNQVANRIEPGKRPRSSMSPTIILDEDGEFLMATGSPGGNSIIAYTAKTIVGVFEWGLSPQEAVELPNLVARGDKVRIEKDRASKELIQGLKSYGFNVKESAGENSGLSVLKRNHDGSLSGGVDSRREGTIEVVDFELDYRR